MITLRTAQNRTVDIPKHCPFIEIKDDAGKLAGLIYVDHDGRIEITTPEDDSFLSYCKQMGLTPCEHAIIGGGVL